MNQWHFWRCGWAHSGKRSIALVQYFGVRNGKSGGMYLLPIDDVVAGRSSIHLLSM